MRKAFSTTLAELGQKDDRILLLTGDLGFMALEPFADRFPERFINVGVAEQNMVGLGTGLAESGFIPFLYSIATFASLLLVPLPEVRAGTESAAHKVLGTMLNASGAPAARARLRWRKSRREKLLLFIVRTQVCSGGSHVTLSRSARQSIQKGRLDVMQIIDALLTPSPSVLSNPPALSDRSLNKPALWGRVQFPIACMLRGKAQATNSDVG